MFLVLIYQGNNLQGQKNDKYITQGYTWFKQPTLNINNKLTLKEKVN